jgi:hypothetical protein
MPVWNNSTPRNHSCFGESNKEYQIPTSDAEFQNVWMYVYSYSSYIPSWHGQRQLYLFI